MRSIYHDLSQDFDTLEIYPLADVHIGEHGHDKKRLSQWLDEVQAADNRYVVVNGDILNMALKQSVSDVYSETLTPDEAIDKAVNLLYPIRHKILAVTEGNHEARAYKDAGISVFHRITKELGIHDVYAPDAALIFISFGRRRKRDDRKMCYSIYMRHGSGGGGKIGGKINRLVAMSETIDCDCYIHSHTHAPAITRKVFIRSDYKNHKATEVDQLFVNTNAFLLTGGYGERAGYTPSSTVYPKIILDGTHRHAQAIL